MKWGLNPNKNNQSVAPALEFLGSAITRRGFDELQLGVFDILFVGGAGQRFLGRFLGIERRLLTAGDNKGLFDPFLPEQPSQKAHLQSMLNEVHEHFIQAVRDGRGERLVESEDLFSGLIWSGERAMDLGLVDAYGNTRSVARELDAEDLVDFTPKSGLLERIAERVGASIGRSLGAQFLPGPGLN